MKARYLDLPSDKLPCYVQDPAFWDACQRGRTLTIDPFAFNGIARHDCGAPHFQVLDDPRPVPPPDDVWLTCAHLIELDESALDAEVEQVYAGITQEAK